MKTPAAHAFSIPVRIYYEDTDAGGVVYYANYLRFFERCRTEWLRSLGHSHTGMDDAAGLGFVVRNVNVDYLKPARLDDLLTIGLEVEKLDRAQVLLRQYARLGDETLATGTVQVVCVDIAKMKSAPFPASLRQKLETLQ